MTSQVYTDIDKGTSEALGGNVLMHNSKTIIKLERVGTGRRRAIIMKHRHLAEGRWPVRPGRLGHHLLSQTPLCSEKMEDVSSRLASHGEVHERRQDVLLMARLRHSSFCLASAA